MASANLDLVRSILVTWERGDYSSAEWADPAIEYVQADGPAPGRWMGLTRMAEAWRAILSAWEDLHVEVDEYRELDGERVLVLSHLSGRGKTSGLEVAQMRTKTASLFHVRGGKVARLVQYWDRERALADLGLAPEAEGLPSPPRADQALSRVEDPAEQQARLRKLPSVDELAGLLSGHPRAVAVAAARQEIEAARGRILTGEDGAGGAEGLREAAERRAERLASPSLRPVINATGVILHTNLGRAPLAPEAALAAATIAAAYSNLEYDLEAGERGSRQAHAEPLIRALSGAEAALAVNNNAAAVMLAVAATAAGREVVVSRGQLVEIGDSFRIPEILEQSGARLVEVGTTNRTRLADYGAAIGPETAALMRVHPSNFRTVGFAEEVGLEELCELASSRGLAVIDDLGSGAITAIEDEPPLRASVAAGADLVCCSGDKLLGGPQAGIIAGRREAVERCRSHPLARAVRIDKLQLAALEATLRLHRDGGPEAIPALAMLATSEDELQARAESLSAAIGPAASVQRAASRPGGGSLPLLELEGPVCSVDPGEVGADELARRLRASEPPVVARIAEGRLLLDPRTILEADMALAAAAVAAALA